MSHAHTIRLAFQLGGLAVCAALFLLLPFRAEVAFLVGIAAWLILCGIGERYFRRHATLAEISANLEDRKNSPG